MLFFIVYLMTVFPVLIAFQIDNLFFQFMDHIIDVIFIFDLFLNFNIAFKNKLGDWETDRIEIAKHYLKSYFIFDFVTSIPLGWVL